MKTILTILLLIAFGSAYGHQKCLNILQSEPPSVSIVSSPNDTPHRTVLFKNGYQVQDYNNIVIMLKEGDTVIFSDKSEFVMGKYLGEGDLARVFDVGNGRVIRIAKGGYQGYLNSSLVLYKGLAKLGIPTDKVLNKKRPTPIKPLEYLIVEKISGITLKDLIRDPSKASFEELTRARLALVEFARKTAHIFYIRDLKADSLVWDGQSWIIWDAIPIINFVRKIKILSQGEEFVASAIQGDVVRWDISRMNYPFYQKQMNYPQAPPLIIVALFPNFCHYGLFPNRIGIDPSTFSSLIESAMLHADSTGFLTIELLQQIVNVTKRERNQSAWISIQM